MLFDELDRQILYALLNGKPLTAWQIAKKITSGRNEIQRLEPKVRYHIEQRLVPLGLISTVKIKKNIIAYTGYKIAKKILCHKGSFIVFTDPIQVFECPHHPCPTKCEINFYQVDGKLVVRGCKLLKNAPQYIIQSVYAALETQAETASAVQK